MAPRCSYRSSICVLVRAALKGGAHGPSIVPGKPDASKLFRMVAGLDKPSMPMDGKLQPEQVQAFRQMDRRWRAMGRGHIVRYEEGCPRPIWKAAVFRLTRGNTGRFKCPSAGLFPSRQTNA